MGSAPLGWEVPCIARPTRKRGVVAGGLVSLPEELVRRAVREGGKDGEKGEDGEGEAGGGWVEDLNGLLGFNKGFRGRYVDVDRHEE